MVEIFCQIHNKVELDKVNSYPVQLYWIDNQIDVTSKMSLTTLSNLSKCI